MRVRPNGMNILVLIAALAIPCLTFGQNCPQLGAPQNQKQAEKAIQQKQMVKYLNVADELLSSNPYKSIQYAKKALRLAKYCESRKCEVSCLIHASWGYVGAGQFDRAYHYAKQALKISKDIKYQKGISDSLNSLGLIYWNQGKHEKSLNTLNKGLLLRESNTK